MFLTLSAEEALSIVPPDGSYSSFPVIFMGDGIGGTYVAAGFATHTVFVIYNRFAAETFKRNMFFPGETSGIGRCYQGNDSLS